jgi:hypothetical protein
MTHSVRARSGAALLVWGLVAAVSACGGASVRDGDGDGTAGSGAGSTASGRGGAGSGATSGSGASSSAGTGTSSAGCEWNGDRYAVGASFPAGDGCNSCTCSASGVSCTEADCVQCDDLAVTYGEAIDEARSCDPNDPSACSETIVAGLQCPCDSFVNPEHADAIALAGQIAGEYKAHGCAEPVLCEPCLPPISAYCSEEGRCANFYMYGGTACRVGDTVYPNGTGGIPDPFSCNTCSCEEGALLCTEIACPVECPPDTAPSSQCAACGPVDNCEVVEYSCLPTCEDTCETGSCDEGVCRSLCG